MMRHKDDSKIVTMPPGGAYVYLWLAQRRRRWANIK